MGTPWGVVHEWGQSRDRGSLAQRSWQPQGSQEVFVLPILPEPFLILFPVFISASLQAQVPVISWDGNPLSRGVTPLGMGTPWDRDPLETGTPSQPHPSKAQQHPKGKCPGNAYQPILLGQGTPASVG